MEQLSSQHTTPSDKIVEQDILVVSQNNILEQLKYKMRGDVLSLVLCLLVQTKKILKTITR